MGTPQLATEEYWDSDDLDLRLNPRRIPETSGLLEFLSREQGIRRSVVLATSGSSGRVKFVVLSKEALLASAEDVSSHLELTSEDGWLASLSDFHVGGLGIYARAFSTGAVVTPFTPPSWDRTGAAFLDALDASGARWTSLTPTHLHDLIEQKIRAPKLLRGLLLGGGRIDPGLVDRAYRLGWPVRASYGMTEAASQVATGKPGEARWLDIVPGWGTKTQEDGRLEIRGEALFTGYALRRGEDWSFESARDEDGWFETGDCVEIRDGQLRHLGRADDLVKVLGELISVSQVEARLAHLFRGSIAVAAIPEARRGHELVLVFEEAEQAPPLLEEVNAHLSGLERISRSEVVAEMPRTEIGKVDRGAVRALVNPS